MGRSNLDSMVRSPSTFLIAPVRGLLHDEFAKIVHDLQDQGWRVHWPARDTDQSDTVGLRICEENRAAIEAADCVHIIWDGKSQGCLFDLGMAFALRKPLHVIEVPPATSDKSFQNVMRALDEQFKA
jgi:nucleoside 2-deoxyribosyltransferase